VGISVGGKVADRKVPDFVVADAVVVEPVSTAKFPANREKNREFRRVCTLYEILKANS
jgi:hypothetical protein